MEPGSSRTPAPHRGGGVIVADPAWRRIIRDPEGLAIRAIAAAGADAIVVLSSDLAVQRLNARHRGRNKPTNVLTFAAYPGCPGEIVLALGTVRREARAAGKTAARHMTHLVVHGALHLLGHDHHAAGEARRMEMAESRILGRMRLPNPWRKR